MKRLVGMLAGVSLLAMAGAANASVLLSTSGMNGTGDNVVFDSEASNDMSAQGHLNDPALHNDIVDFTDLASTAWTSAAASGQDIKITGATDIGIVVKDSTNTTLVDTAKQVFSLKGTGTISLTVDAVDSHGVAETPFTFSPFTINNSQSFFILTVADGEQMTGLQILDTGGTISDFEHYRIDTLASLAETPLPAALPMFVGGLGVIGLMSRRRKQKASASIFA